MTTATLPGLPTGLGATVIQANAISLQTGDYTDLSWDEAQKRVRTLGKQFFLDFPSGVKDPNWRFYTRKDMASASASQSTIIGIRTRVVSVTQKALNTTTMVTGSFPASRTLVEVFAWHYCEVTLTNGSKYGDVILSKASVTVLQDPETSALLSPTNGYQAVYEAVDMLLKPVAASAPLWDPTYAIISGVNPNA